MEIMTMTMLKHIKEYDLGDLRKDLDSVGFEKLPPDNLTADDFFEETMDYDQYIDVSGPGAEMTIDRIIEEFKERIAGIPQQHRIVAAKAIKDLWLEKINRDLK